MSSVSDYTLKVLDPAFCLLKTLDTIGIIVKDQSSHLVYLNICIK